MKYVLHSDASPASRANLYTRYRVSGQLLQTSGISSNIFRAVEGLYFSKAQMASFLFSGLAMPVQVLFKRTENTWLLHLGYFEILNASE